MCQRAAQRETFGKKLYHHVRMFPLCLNSRAPDITPCFACTEPCDSNNGCSNRCTLTLNSYSWCLGWQGKKSHCEAPIFHYNLQDYFFPCKELDILCCIWIQILSPWFFFSLLSLMSLDRYFFRHTVYVSVVTIWVHQFCVSDLSPRHFCSWLLETLKGLNLTKRYYFSDQLVLTCESTDQTKAILGFLVLPCSGIEILFCERELARTIKRWQSAFYRNHQHTFQVFLTLIQEIGWLYWKKQVKAMERENWVSVWHRV